MVQRSYGSSRAGIFTRFVMGYWRLMDWKMSPGELVSFIEQHLDLGRNHRRSRRYLWRLSVWRLPFGEALKRAPHLHQPDGNRQQMRYRHPGAR